MHRMREHSSEVLVSLRLFDLFVKVALSICARHPDWTFQCSLQALDEYLPEVALRITFFQKTSPSRESLNYQVAPAGKSAWGFRFEYCTDPYQQNMG